MTLYTSTGPGRKGLHRLLLVGVLVFLGIQVPMGRAQGQEELTRDELERLYQSAGAGYVEAFRVLEVLNSQNERAYEEYEAARAAVPL